jgi:hypothetical protein
MTIRSTEGPAERLSALLHDIFADGVVEPEEREALHDFYRQGGLTLDDVREVFTGFVRATWGEVLEDGVIGRHEREKLIAIVRELKLPPEALPQGVVRLLASA